MQQTSKSASRPLRVLFIFGTRPEAIKLCPIVLNMQARPEEFEVKVCWAHSRSSRITIST
jgi:UDP-N-acetylglucosamine 2-epimerase